MKKLMTGAMLFMVFIGASNAQSAVNLIPADYEEFGRYFKVGLRYSEHNEGRKYYKFYECQGDIVNFDCAPIFDRGGYSKSELNAIESKEAVKGGLLLTAEVVTGGIIWKRLMKFTLGGAVRLTARTTGWREGVANGTVALAVMTPTNAGATVYTINQAERLLNIIDPFERFSRSELVDTDEYNNKKIINLGYDFNDAYSALDDMLSSVE